MSAPEQSICTRIDNVLYSNKTRVLFCRDNGVGLNKTTMNRLLSEGNTSKTVGGAGSVGVGHLTAFAASDLRYIVYGGKTAEGFCGSGRALLAAWLDKKCETTRSPEGTLAESETKQHTLFDSGFFYLEEPPSLLHKEITSIHTTGAVIAVLGFDGFELENNEEIVNNILKVAASHFLPAVWQGRMTVTVRDGRINPVLNSGSVGTVLNPQGLISRRGGIQLPEGIAYRSWKTINDGTLVDNSLDVEIRFRPLGEQERNTRVNFYRDGMWITYEAPQVTGFGGYQPFDATVIVDNGSELYDLIRESEGATHYHINLHNLASSTKKNRLRKLLQQITSLLKEQAKEISQEEFVPTDFATFGIGQDKQAEIVKPLPLSPKPIESQDEISGRQSVPVAGPGNGNGNGDNDGNDEDGKPDIPPAKPKRGRPAQIRKSVRVEQKDGMITSVVISIDSNPHPAVGVRVIQETGSDETCDMQLGTRFYSIEPADRLTEQSDPWEVRWENGTGIFRVVLNPPRPAEIGVPVVDLVVRR